MQKSCSLSVPEGGSFLDMSAGPHAPALRVCSTMVTKNQASRGPALPCGPVGGFERHTHPPSEPQFLLLSEQSSAPNFAELLEGLQER